MKKKTFPNSSQEAVWMSCSLHGAETQAAMGALLGPFSVKLPTREEIISMGCSEHDVVHGWDNHFQHTSQMISQGLDGYENRAMSQGGG